MEKQRSQKAWRYEKVDYTALNSRAKENYNFAKLGAALADYGFHCLRLTDDYGGADLLAVHAEGDVLKIQLKGRLTLSPKYVGKEIHIAFPVNDDWYVCPHDEVLEIIDKEKSITQTKSWNRKNNPYYAWASHPKGLLELVVPWKISHDPSISQTTINIE